MFSLFVDQSNGAGIFALFRDGEVVEVQHRMVQGSSQPCAILQDILDHHSLSLSSIDYLACGVGPGSYTGIRSAAATIQGISFALQKPIVAVSSLMLLVPEEDGAYLVAADAKIGGVFVQEVCVTSGECHSQPPVLKSIEEVCAKAAAGLTLAVQSIEWVKKKGIDPQLLNSLRYREVSLHVLMAARVAAKEWEAGRLYTASCLPLTYLRKTQAEIELSEKR